MVEMGSVWSSAKGATYSWEDGEKLKVETADEAGWLCRESRRKRNGNIC